MILLDLLPGLKRKVSTKGGEWSGPCPFCGGRDLLQVWPHQGATGRYWCRGCRRSWGNDYAIWRRIRLIPFTVQIPPEEQDRRLSEKLRGELPGILNWILAGCLNWQREGLTPPKEVKAATDSYREEMDIIGQFIAERCLTGPVYEATAKNLYSAFKEWATSQGEKHPLSQQIFGMKLVERGFNKRRGTGGKWIWENLGIVE